MTSKREQIRDAFGRHTGVTPAFDRVFEAAVTRQRQRRRHYSYGISAMIVALVLVAILHDPASPSLVDEDVLLGSTRWRAPSDVLLPTRDTDLYSTMPVLVESTKSGERTL